MQVLKRYIGENHFNDIVMPDSIPAIVDKDLFEEVQLKIKKNSRAPARHKAGMLSGITMSLKWFSPM